MSQIANTIKEHLSAHPSREFVCFGQETINGGAFLELMVRLEQKLSSFKNKDCIAINLDTSPTALACVIASLSVAKNTAYLDTNWPSKELDATIDSIGANLLIENKLRKSNNYSEQQLHVSLRDGHTPQDFMKLSSKGPRFTCFTSGTTGTPKGCVRSENSWVSSFKVDQEFTRINQGNTLVVLGSFAHSLGIYAAIRGLYAGAKVSIFRKFDASKIVKHVQSTQDAILFGVPTQFVSLARATHEPIKSKMRLLSTGAKLPEMQANTIQRAFPNADIIEFYGTSELSYVSARTTSALDKSTSVGKPLPGVQITIGNSNSTEDVGLIRVRSKMAFDGYIIDGKFSATSDWIAVGDTGYLGEGGSLHLVGRIDRMFQSSGRNIVPEAIESALMCIDGIKNAAAFGIPDTTRENRIVSVIETDGKHSRRSLTHSLKDRITYYTIPNKFYLCQEWPKTASGKTDVRKLKEQIMSSTLVEIS